MGKITSIYIDDDLLEKVKKKKLPLSKIVREALNEWFEKEAPAKDFDLLENALYKKMTKEGEKAWKEIKKERDRW